MNARARRLIATIIAVFATVSAASATEFLRVDPGAFYGRFSFTIDLLVLLFLFTAIAHATLGSRLGGRGGRALSLAVGLALAVSLSLWAREREWSLRSFGIVGAVILFALFGAAIHRLLARTGTSKAMALSAVFSFALLALIATSPAFSEWLREQTPWLGGALLILLLLALIHLATGLKPSPHFGRKRAGDRRSQNGSNGKERVNSLKREKNAITGGLRPGTRRLSRSAKRWKGAIRSLRRLKRSGPDAGQKISEVAAETKRAMTEVGEARESVATVRDLIERMKRLDESLLTDKSRQKLQEMSPEACGLLRKSWRDEMERLGVEKKAGRVEERIERHLREIGNRFGNALSLLEAGRVAEASEQARQAERALRELRNVIHFLERMEAYLLSLVKADITIEGASRRLPPPPTR